METEQVSDRYLVDAVALRTTVGEMLEAVGLPPEDARGSADVLVAADLRGVESHGVSNMLRRYLEWIDSGHLNPRPEPRETRSMASTAAYDADAGLGIAILPRLMTRAMDKARAHGVGMVAVRNARHSGMLAYHAMLPLAEDMIGICMTSGGPRVVPTFGRIARLGTNPLAFAAPTATDPPFVFDAATSTVAYNKIANARRSSEPFNAGWCADEDGIPIMGPTPSTRPLDWSMLPLGASPETSSHKGYAIGAIVEILASILPAGAFMGRLGPDESAHFLTAISPEAFGDVEGFKQEMSEFTKYLRSTPPATGKERVLVPNDLEWETEQRRVREGIPIHSEVIAWFDATCDRLRIRRLSRLD